MGTDDDDDRRGWARIEASLACTVATAEAAFEAKVVNVSRSGAAIVAEEKQVKVGESVSLLLERAEGSVSVGLPGEVVRVLGKGVETLYGIHFEALPPDVEEQLLELIKVLTDGPGAGRREDPRVSTRIAVKCKSRDAFAATLSDLSRGGLSIRCPAEVVAGTTLVVEFGVGDYGELISIEGEVAHVEELPNGKHQAGIRFEPPTLEKRAEVQRALDELLGLVPPAAQVEEAPVEPPLLDVAALLDAAPLLDVAAAPHPPVLEARVEHPPLVDAAVDPEHPPEPAPKPEPK